MESLFEQILYWHWIVLGLLLVILEMLLPGFVLIWFGVGALLVGSILYVIPEMSWQWQLLVFSIFSLTSVFAWRIWSKNNLTDDPESDILNQRGRALIGRETLLIESIVNGVGRIQVDDTFWRVNGKDLGKGKLIRVVDVEGATLKVEHVS
ncbi:MAG: NfeD family protein [Gammaproteobacteria bacterium]|nr:NfeD family protein [Gammaproteobacteria bacterium]